MRNPDDAGVFEGDIDMIMEKVQSDILQPSGGHNMFIYDSLSSFERFYGEYAAKWLARNEIVLIATQYQTFDRVKKALGRFGVDAVKHASEGSILIRDAQHGYLLGDTYNTFRLATTLLERAKKEGRRGVSWVGDMGSFIGFHRIGDLMEYELSCPQKYDDKMLRTVCCYHRDDFRKLSRQQRDILQAHHFKSLVVC